MPKPKPNWSIKLSHPITLKVERYGKAELATLEDAAHAVVAMAEGVIKSASLDHAAALVLKAAISGKKGDIAKATEQVEIVLRGRHWI